MPKIKTNRAIAKRFKRTASGKLKCGHAKTSHRFHGKTKKQRRQLKGTRMANKTISKTYNKMLHN
ncbi:50S ribosomal protein L35 [Acetilactobacillus jinshanensis]|uniref:Large ribosomal subunit protein bL35 n=1 Tax=Acetilactobacillus jinshanensis TaxID=1720083 RepID=A0A4P6ZLD7_9LACO|nr:50S ribosomal protein L35 [Acetilactobacillus jinshanensis]QBP18671.1 50S ribosomal protein L35 [Acetilactobacillus jinshanensis]URL61547.1 50S ribosomal protein L35 [uncultured bacterium]